MYTRKCILLKGAGNQMPVSSNLIFCLKSSIYMHTRFYDLEDQRVQNLRNCLVEVLLNSFSTAFFFSWVLGIVVVSFRLSSQACFYALLWAASFLVASCNSDVSTSSAGSWTYLTTDPLMKQFFTDNYKQTNKKGKTRVEFFTNES